jgi:hypothetical protein
MTASELLKNQRAVEHALAQQRLEGLVVPPEVVSDLQRMARGEMTSADALRNAHARFAHVEIRQ